MEADLTAFILGDGFPVIKLALLRSLIVSIGLDPMDLDPPIVRLLSVLDVPSLECLSVDMGLSADMRTSPTALWESASSLLLGDPPRLRALTLCNMVLGGGLVDFVSRLPHLEYLEFVHCKMEAEGLMAFILDPHDNTVCPRLASLSFRNTTIPGDILVKVVQSRTSLPGISLDTCLCSVAVIECAGIEDHQMSLKGIMEACGGHWASTLYDGD